MDFKELIKGIFGEAKNEKFAEARTASGQTIEAESFEAGNAVFLRTSEGDLIPLPEGEYELEDGSRIMVDMEGTIAEFMPAEAGAEEEMAEEKVPEPQEMSEEVAEEKAEEPVEFATVEQLNAVKEEILAGLEIVAQQMKAVEAKKVELSETQKAELDQLKKKVHQPASLDEVEEKKEEYSAKLPSTRGAKFVNPTLARVRENNLKIANR